MKCKRNFTKLLMILLIGFVVVNLSMTGINNGINPNKAQFISESRYLNDGHLLPREVWGTSDNSQMSEPLAYLFQILFILFIISPPLIVILLFLIWRELKVRNKLK